MTKHPICALYGGSFDPVHQGHIAVVDRVIAALHPELFRLIPCQLPPHKDRLHATSRHRVAMLELAFRHYSGLMIDQREIQRADISYSFTTVSQIRQELGGNHSLVFVIGWDSWLNFTTWHRWQEILQQTNLLVLTRPGQYEAEGPDREELQHYFERHRVVVSELASQTHGAVAVLTDLHMDVASNTIRAGIARGESVAHWVPAVVLDYIDKHKIYRA